jgi:hypothetical protein
MPYYCRVPNAKKFEFGLTIALPISAAVGPWQIAFSTTIMPNELNMANML